MAAGGSRAGASNLSQGSRPVAAEGGWPGRWGGRGDGRRRPGGAGSRALAGFGVSGGRGLAYGVVLQAIEVLTALGLGLPALAAEGLLWSELRRRPSTAAD